MITPVAPWLSQCLGVSFEQLTPEKLLDWQMEQIRRTVARAKENSRFYAKLYEGICPEDLRSEKDLALLPTTCEEDLRGQENAWACVPLGGIHRIVTQETSGTTGAKKKIFFSEKDQDRIARFFLVGMSTIVREGKVLVMISSPSPGSVGGLLIRALGGAGMEVEVAGMEGEIEASYEKLRRFEPGAIVGSPWHIMAMLKLDEEQGYPCREFVRSVLLATDFSPPAVVEAVQKGWDCRCVREYGSTEMGFAGGIECLKGTGYHIRAADAFFEISSEGEILYTSLRREAMPFIRYRTGDLGRMLYDPCPCGDPMPRLEVVGRKRNRVLGERFCIDGARLAALAARAGAACAKIRVLRGRPDRLEVTLCQAGSPADSAYFEKLVRTAPDLAPGLAAGELTFSCKTQPLRSFQKDAKLSFEIIK